MSNLTFGIIKPDATRAGHMGSIIQRIIDAGFQLRAMKTLHMTLKEAEGFYAVHRERPFFGGLTEFMSSVGCSFGLTLGGINGLTSVGGGSFALTSTSTSDVPSCVQKVSHSSVNS